MPCTRVNNCTFYYELSGSGPDLVFIHGENHGTEYFEFQIPYFSKTHRCLTYYRRAHGLTECPNYGYSLENQTRDLVELMDELKLERPVIIAIAFGSTIAVNLALEYPEKIRAIVMVAWSELEGTRDYIEHFERQSGKVVDVLKTQGKEGLVRYILQEGNKISPVLPHEPRLREMYARMFATRPVESYDKRMELVTSVPNLIRRFHEIKIPVLGIDGERDPFPSHPELLKHAASFQEILVPDTDRFVHWERPEQFNDIVSKFLSKVRDG